jgi:hypothetical protein
VTVDRAAAFGFRPLKRYIYRVGVHLSLAVEVSLTPLDDIRNFGVFHAVVLEFQAYSKTADINKV